MPDQSPMTPVGPIDPRLASFLSKAAKEPGLQQSGAPLVGGALKALGPLQGLLALLGGQKLGSTGATHPNLINYLGGDERLMEELLSSPVLESVVSPSVKKNRQLAKLLGKIKSQEIGPKTALNEKINARNRLYHATSSLYGVPGIIEKNQMRTLGYDGVSFSRRPHISTMSEQAIFSVPKEKLKTRSMVESDSYAKDSFQYNARGKKVPLFEFEERTPTPTQELPRDSILYDRSDGRTALAMIERLLERGGSWIPTTDKITPVRPPMLDWVQIQDFLRGY